MLAVFLAYSVAVFCIGRKVGESQEREQARVDAQFDDDFISRMYEPSDTIVRITK